MKLLLINYMETTAPGGINRAVREVGAEMVQRGHAVTVLQVNPLNLPAEEMCDGFKIIRVKSRVASFLYDLNPAMYLYLRKNFTRLNPDVVHVHGYASLLPWEIMHFLRGVECPVAFSPHYDIRSHDTLAGKYFWNVFNHAIGGYSYAVAGKVICASRFESENVKGDFHVTDDQIEAIPHGVTRIETPRRDLRDTHHISLLYFGWLLELKGVHYILKALYELQHKFGKRARLKIIGDGPYKGTLSKLARELRLESSISWHPFVPEEELHREIRAADFFLLLSRSENYGIAVAEALALGVPSIVAKTTALVEFLDEPGCYGIDYPPDPTELAELIINVKDADPHVGPLSERIRTWGQVVTKYEKVYVTLLHNAKRDNYPPVRV
jgi:glycosyltransferase involved in cell wall biosynthesis